MLSFGLLFFSLVAIMVPRAPQAVAGGDKGALEEGNRRLSPGWGGPGAQRLQRRGGHRCARTAPGN